MKRLFRFLLFAAIVAWFGRDGVRGQVTATYTAQPVESMKAVVGRKIPGVALIWIKACQSSPTSLTVDSSRLYSASTFDMIAPALVPAVLTRSLNRNWKKATMDAIKTGAAAAAILTVSGIVTASGNIATGLVIGTQVADLFSQRLQERMPDPSVVLSNLMHGSVIIPAGGCYDGLGLAQYVRGHMGRATVEIR